MLQQQLLPLTLRDTPTSSMLKRNVSIRTIGRSVHWETVIPATFFAASSICFISPQHSAAVSFLIIGFATLFFDSVAAYFTRPAAHGLSLALTESLDAFSDEDNSEQAERLLSALANSIGRGLQSSALTNTLKSSLVDALKDDDIQKATINTLQGALIKASEDEGFRETALSVTKNAFVGALSNDALIKELMEAVVGAIVSASQQEELTNTLLGVVTQAVSQALADEDFMGEVRGAVKESLSDGELYRAGARGVISAAFGTAGSGGAGPESKPPSKSARQLSSTKEKKMGEETDPM